MKQIKLLIIIVIFGMFTTSCDDYLKESSRDLLVPSRVEDFIPLLYGSGYPKSFDKDAGWLKLMTDDIEMSYLQNAEGSSSGSAMSFDVMDGGEGRYAYLWDYNMEQHIIDQFWEKLYANILGCNSIIDALDEMEYNKDEENKYLYLAAQAYALRAYHYFCLINTYALPYSEENKNQLGVIIRTKPDIDEEPVERSTVGEVWEFINNDIEKAIEYMDKNTPSANKHLISPAALWLLCSRIALFQEKWDDVIKYSKLFLEENNYILDLNSINEEKMGTSSSEDFFILNMDKNKEIIFTFGSSNHYYDYLSSDFSLFDLGFRVSYQSESSLIKAYEENDLRLKAYFKQDYVEKGSWGEPDKKKYAYYYPIKYKNNGNNYHENWRTVEVFLNIAEAYARKDNGINEDAIELLNKLRSKRIKKENFVELNLSDFKNKTELVKYVWEERRRELCFEEALRFWDLRRMGMPQIKHRWYSDKENYETYILEGKGNNYVVQIPSSEMTYNDLVTPNPRDVISAQ